MAYGRTDLPPYHEDAPAHGLCSCCCCLSLSVLLFLVVIIGIVVFFVLVMKPEKPEFMLQSVSLQSFQVDKAQLQGIINFAVYLSMNITLIFSASNPNKVAIDYSPTELSCVYKNALLGVAVVPAFTQPAHSHTTLTAVVVVNHLNVLQSTSLDLVDDATLKDRVVLYISGPVEARVKVLGINSPKVKVSVDCGITIRPQEREIAAKDCSVGQLTLTD